MKDNFILKASGIAIAMALGILAAPSMAQDNPSSTMDPAGQAGPSYDAQQYSDYPTYLRRLDDRSWGNQPRTQYRAKQQSQGLRGAEGPMRSDSPQVQGSYWDKTKSYFHQPVGNRGEAGFLNWRESSTDTP